MNREIQQVELNLTDVGRKCNPDLVEKKHSHFHQIKDDALDRGTRLDLLRRTMLMGRCRRTGIRRTTLPPSPLHHFDLEGLTEAWISVTGREASGCLSPSTQDPVTTRDGFSFPKRPAQPIDFPPPNPAQPHRQATCVRELHPGRYHRGSSRLLPGHQLFVRRCGRSFPAAPPGSHRKPTRDDRSIWRECVKGAELVHSHAPNIEDYLITSPIRCAWEAQIPASPVGS